MAKKKSKNEISVSEFKSWISGIEDMQEEDWVPNKGQWDKIKAKISMLVEDSIELPAPVEQLPYQQPYTPVNYQTYTSPMPTYQQSTPMMSDITYTNGDSPDFL